MWLCAWPPAFLSVLLSARPSFCLCLSVRLPASLPSCILGCVPVRRPACRSTCLFCWLSDRLSVCLLHFHVLAFVSRRHSCSRENSLFFYWQTNEMRLQSWKFYSVTLWIEHEWLPHKAFLKAASNNKPYKKQTDPFKARAVLTVQHPVSNPAEVPCNTFQLLSVVTTLIKWSLSTDFRMKLC